MICRLKTSLRHTVQQDGPQQHHHDPQAAAEIGSQQIAGFIPQPGQSLRQCAAVGSILLQLLQQFPGIGRQCIVYCFRQCSPCKNGA